VPVLVTGGSGFIGSNLVEELLERGREVKILDNFSTGRRENLAHLGGHIEQIEGDLRSYERVSHAVRNCDVVFHQGALPSVPRSLQDPISSNEVNVVGTLNVLLAARDAGVRRVVFASSSSIYGDLPGMPRVESAPVAPAAPYAVSKLAGEQYCMVASRVYGLETVALRYFNVFGRRQDPLSHYSAVIPRFITALQEGRAPIIYGTGEQSRDFTHISNVVQANLLAAEAEGAAGEVFNVGAGECHSLNELAGALNRIMGTDIEPEYAPARAGDVAKSLADVSKAERILGYDASVSFDEGLARTVEAYAPQAAAAR
jgi:nucleoside-diphosphate-sugar epimerase